MTANKLKKKDLIEELKIECNWNNKEEAVELLKIKTYELMKIFESEAMCSIPFNYGNKEEVLIKRNIVCANNFYVSLFNDNYEKAWFEMIDILDFKKNEDYISKNEIALFYIIMKSFYTFLEKK